MTYWVLKVPMQDDGAHLSLLPDGGPDNWRYQKGVTLAAEHPQGDDAVMCFDTNTPDGIKLYDFVSNINDLIIVNSEVREVLSSFALENVEYLPVLLQDHSKRIASDDYEILNVLGSVDAIDMERSDVTMGNLIVDQISEVDDLVLNEDIPEDCLIFRAKTKLDEIFIHESIKDALENAGVSGFSTFEANGWDGMDF